MKKLLALSLAAVISLFMLAGCGSSDAVELFKKAEVNLEKAGNIELDEGRISMNMGGEDASLHMGFDFSVHIIPDRENVYDSQLQANIKADIMGATTETDIWYKDKELYLESEGEKGKTPLDDELKETIGDLQKSNKDLDIAEYVTDAKKDGNTVTLKLDSDKLFNDAMKELGTEDGTVSLKDATVTAEIEGETMKSFKFDMVMDMNTGDATGSGGNLSTTMKITIDVGKIVTDEDNKIEYPDLSQFVEIPEDTGEGLEGI